MANRGSLNAGHRIKLALAQLKFMMGVKLGCVDQDIYDYLPHEDAPELTFDELRRRYEDDGE